MSAYKPYPKYKNSGVEWLGEVPEGWTLLQLKFALSNIEYGTSESSRDTGEFEILGMGDISDGKVSTPGIRFLDNIPEKLLLRPGDLLFNRTNSLSLVGKSGIFWGTGKTSFASYLVRFRTAIDVISEYLNYLLGTNSILGTARSMALPSISQANLNPTRYSAITICKPPEPEQIQIAAFLDRECGKLDALQGKQERLIALLKEKRQALISHAVTKGLPGVASAKTGLDPTAKLKPSGIEWLGEVPEGWLVTRLKFHLSCFEQGWSPQCEGRNKEDGEYGVLKVGCVNGGTFKIEEHKALPPDLEPRIQYVIKRGDLLVSRANTRELVGSAAVVDRDYDDILLCDKLYRLRFDKGVSEIYISLYLGTSEVRQQIELDATGASASMVNIGQDCIKELHLALPPLAEQCAIVAHLNEKCGKIGQLKSKAERAIALLKERRSALISAAVTGKIDVREF